MFSFLVIAKTQQKRQEYIQTFCNEKGIGKFDVHIFTPEENSFGIQQVKDLQKVAYLKAIQSEQKALILENAQSLTLDAQNALLKLLEEPPAHTFIFLSATSEQTFLPTILSRCKKITLAEEEKVLSQEMRQTLSENLSTLVEQGIGEKLFLAEKIAGDKEHITTWFEDMIFFLREKMLQDPENPLFVKVIEKFIDAYKIVQTTNVAPRMILEECFLSL